MRRVLEWVAARDAHEPWRRIDLEFTGAALAFSPEACTSGPR